MGNASVFVILVTAMPLGSVCSLIQQSHQTGAVVYDIINRYSLRTIGGNFAIGGLDAPGSLDGSVMGVPPSCDDTDRRQDYIPFILNGWMLSITLAQLG